VVSSLPAADRILAGLTAIANDWRPLAVAWHGVLAAFLLWLLAGGRPSIRVVGQLLALLPLSVGMTAWFAGNPFNGTIFAMLAAIFAAMAWRQPSTAVRLASTVRVAAGLGLVVFGSSYPHFVRVDSWTTYLYASPLGVVPCPTLSVVMGVTLLVRDLHSRWWMTVLATAGLLYGAIGVFRLHVMLDLVLLLASAMLAVTLPKPSAGIGRKLLDASRTRSARVASKEMV
jgi:hypothetical protein